MTNHSTSTAPGERTGGDGLLGFTIAITGVVAICALVVVLSDQPMDALADVVLGELALIPAVGCWIALGIRALNRNRHR